MEGSNLGGWFLSGSSGRSLDMEMPLHKRQQDQMGQPLMTHRTQHFPPLNMVSGLDNEQPLGFGDAKELTLGGMAMDLGKGKGISLGPSCSNNSTSEDEEPSFEDVNGENGKRKFRWQRMKWTDNVIRLLIAVVASVGDDAMHEVAEGPKRKFGMLHKKGKWKMVSNIMISKGCCVSPQQCEDKFNDLNKRYKKLNEILGRGTCCQVVENPSLMDSMPQLTNRAKNEVRKILSSKHLFYREMCAYHNGQLIPGCQDVDQQGHASTLNGNDLFEDHEAERIDESESDDADSYGDDAEANHGRLTGDCSKGGLNEGNSAFWPLPDTHGGDRVELAAKFPDLAKSPAERRAWIQQQLRQSEEQKVQLLAESLDLEKQRFKWLRFRSKKDRELERLRLENEKMKLENDGKVLVLKQTALRMGIPMSEILLERTSVSCQGVQGRDEVNSDRH
ncbi:hypothetical protein RND81_12G182000 [Saponaria officinalis]|uniref:Myb/SANT-like DNA-binding domain-containing protein n=1 Tax=Saponaria officinalis TaxID=3572 RepID=A0AAW1HCE1_SAPOF